MPWILSSFNDHKEVASKMKKFLWDKIKPNSKLDIVIMGNLGSQFWNDMIDSIGLKVSSGKIDLRVLVGIPPENMKNESIKGLLNETISSEIRNWIKNSRFLKIKNKINLIIGAGRVVPNQTIAGLATAFGWPHNKMIVLDEEYLVTGGMNFI
jgi:phosphatidylserine/phosphatidylglycerophosphate/cardiolipin synthase-like enzyme